VKGVIVQELGPEVQIMAFSILGRTFLELESLEIVASGILEKAACPASSTCNLRHISYSYRAIIKTYQADHTHRTLILHAKLLAGSLPCLIGPPSLYSYIRESISAQDQAGVFVHSSQQHLFNVILVIRRLRFGAWGISFTKRCWDCWLRRRCYKL
jgi:hypothetical protein